MTVHTIKLCVHFHGINNDLVGIQIVDYGFATEFDSSYIVECAANTVVMTVNIDIASIQTQ